ncbi:hypothetical protein O181_042414 [Austropuccinia psidii MF-1]|uniref:N-acetyltransferase domain-containing protein n=1 Tax=Austropuccinia psidii MF-1 TaxID=1389203 RepID=A0A9Q3DG27_9BASI|nr:hypothetical protein [Austropuccinia psidii MF-1]
MSETTTTTHTGSGKVRVIVPPPRISVVDLTPNNVGTLRKLNSVLFPVNYSDKFYAQVLEDHLADFCKLIYYNDLPVGAVCCRIEPDPKVKNLSNEPNKESSPDAQPNETKLYIMTLGVLAPYRRQGLATRLLDQVTEAAHKSLQTSAVSSIPPTETSVPSVPESKKLAQKGKKPIASKVAETTPSKSNVKGQSFQPNKEQATQIPPISMAYVHVQFESSPAAPGYWLKNSRVFD